jgi:Flp pilus assembly protein TadG
MVQTATLDLEGPLAVIRFLLMSSPGSRDHFVTVRAPSAGTSGLRRLVRDCSGAVAVEFLIVLGPLLLLLLGTFDIGIVTLTATRINFAVEAAAKCGAISATMCASPPQTAAYGASIAGLRGLNASGFLVTTEACGMNVTATYAYSGVVLPAITLSAGACYPTG